MSSGQAAALARPRWVAAILSFSERRPIAMCCCPGLTLVLLRLLLLPILPIPDPGVHDEFSYLLGADTFASGRLTNPPHPLWSHFETFHINMSPTYCSKYPPAQAAVLAFGQVVFGHPWFGVLISMGLMLAVLCWALQQWVSPVGVWVGVSLAIFEWGLPSYWINSYWGGAMPAIGGALLIGVLPRLARKPDSQSVAVATIGLMILANSRPYEGVLLAFAFTLALLLWMRRNGRSWRSLLCREVVIPFLLIAAPVVLWMGYYNYRTTGNPTTFAYSLNQARYAASPHLYILPDHEIPVYNHEIFRKLWVDFDRDQYLYARAHRLETAWKVLRVAYTFFFPDALVLAMLAAFVLRRESSVWMLAIPVLVVFAGLAVAKSVLPHYFAPVFAAFVILIAMGIEALGKLRYRVAGYLLGHLILLIIVGFSFRHVVAHTASAIVQAHYEQPPPATHALHERHLQTLPGKHLVMVRYTASLDDDWDWVYNRADIDASTVVWARELDNERNRNLFEYYKDRTVWLFDPAVDPKKMVPYPR